MHTVIRSRSLLTASSCIIIAYRYISADDDPVIHTSVPSYLHPAPVRHFWFKLLTNLKFVISWWSSVSTAFAKLALNWNSHSSTTCSWDHALSDRREGMGAYTYCTFHDRTDVVKQIDYSRYRYSISKYEWCPPISHAQAVAELHCMAIPTVRHLQCFLHLVIFSVSSSVPGA